MSSRETTGKTLITWSTTTTGTGGKRLQGPVSSLGMPAKHRQDPQDCGSAGDFLDMLIPYFGQA